jgi:hypothetical protein
MKDKIEDPSSQRPKRIPPGTVSLMIAGDLIYAQCPSPEYAGLFRRYEELFVSFASINKEDRQLVYKFFTALILTSLAKKSESIDEKKKLFDLKNKLYFEISKNPEYRRKVTFAYLQSKNFRVLEYCSNCQKTNTESNLDKRNWKFCKRCRVDRNFYNVLSMRHKWNDGEMSIFLSNELISEVSVNRQKLRKASLGDATEGGHFKKFQYHARNLDVFTVASVMKLYDKIMPKT